MDFPRVTIHAAALRNNLAVVRRLAPHARVMAAVKSDAYGHGLAFAAQALSDADAFGLARLEEAIALRQSGFKQALVLLEGVINATDLAIAGAHDLEVVVHTAEQIEWLAAYRGEHRFTVWLKIDTGMHRLGLPEADAAAAARRLTAMHSVADLRLMTHFAASEALAASTTDEQLARFDKATRGLSFARSAANSAAIIARPDAHFDWVRPGLMLYGMSPFTNRPAAEWGLQPAMTLSTRLIAVHDIDAGESVGYGGIWTAQRRSRIGVAAVGYGDGYPRTMRDSAMVRVRGREAPLAGRVSMDMITIDLSNVPDATLGDEVICWGKGLPTERVAEFAATIPYELVCRVTARVHRRYVSD